MKNIFYWLEGEGKPYQSGKVSQEEIKLAYESYWNDSSSGSSSSRESNPLVRKWKAVPITKVEEKQTIDRKGKVSINSKPMNDFIAISKSMEDNLIDFLKSKVRNSVLGSSFHNAFQSNHQGPKNLWGTKIFN